MMTDTLQKLYSDSFNNSYQSYGYSYIFDKKAEKYKKLSKFLKVLGILVPALAASIVFSFYKESKLVGWVIWLASIISIIQFGLSIWALIDGWDEELAYSFEAIQDHDNIYSKFKKLAKYPPNNETEFKNQFELIDTEYNSRCQQDRKHNISDSDLRKGMRYTLREHQIECAGCRKIPTSMKPSECPICGDF